MGFRFRKSFGKGPFRVTVSKSGVGYSVGGKGFRYTKKAGGGTRTTASIPGTGLSYVKETGPKANAAQHASPPSTSVNASPVKPLVSEPNTVKTVPTPSKVIVRHKYCPKCRKEISLDAVKCPYCGKRWNGSDIDINPGWGIITLVLGLALIGSSPLLALVFLSATIWLAIKSIKRKKAKSFPVAATTPLKPQVAQNHGPDIQTIERPLHGSTLNEPTAGLPVEDDSDAELDESVMHESITGSSAAKTYRVTGMSHYMDNIMRLATENPGYNMSKADIIDFGITDERIWKYDFCPCVTELIPEPNNPYDPNAIMVVVDGEHVGYIKAGSCPHVLKVIKEGRIRSISCQIGGGPYKEVCEEIDDDTYKNVYRVEHGETNISVRLTVYEEK